jgi:hypothetical protein
MIFRDLYLSDDELKAFMRFIGQVAALDLDEKDSVL